VRALPGRHPPIPAKVDQKNELPAIRSNPGSYRYPAASDRQQPFSRGRRWGRSSPDECVEVTPQSIRLRKVELSGTKRESAVSRRKREAASIR
jgi:hypothetical protein